MFKTAGLRIFSTFRLIALEKRYLVDYKGKNLCPPQMTLVKLLKMHLCKDNWCAIFFSIKRFENGVTSDFWTIVLKVFFLLDFWTLYTRLQKELVKTNISEASAKVKEQGSTKSRRRRVPERVSSKLGRGLRPRRKAGGQFRYWNTHFAIHFDFRQAFHCLPRALS